MKNVFYSLTLLLLLASCGAMNKSSAVPGKQIVVERTDEEILITETFSRHEELAAAEIKTEENTSRQSLTDSGNESFKRDGAAAIPFQVKDTLYLDVDPQAEAVESERIARNAQIWAFVPLLSIVPFFFLAIPVGIIVTLAILHKFKKLTFVTQLALDRTRKARITLLVISIILITLLILLLALILFAFALL